jgi:Protein of unknown function (DUF3723)
MNPSNTSLDGSSDLETALSEEYSNSNNFSDGEIYLKLRQYSTQANRSAGVEFAEKCIKSRISKSKRSDYERLLGSESLFSAFDALRVFPGLWYGFQIGHKWMKCEEVNKRLSPLRDANRSTVDSALP